MKTTKITEDQIKDLKISSLPTRPTAPTSYGGLGYSAAQMKAIFDALPLFIIERFNSLLDDLASVGADSASASIPTGIKEGHTLATLFADVKNGNLASYLSVGAHSLLVELSEMKERIRRLEEVVDV